MKLLSDFCTLWGLLSRIPLPAFLQKIHQRPLHEALPLIPLVGALMGLLVALPSFLLANLIPLPAAAWISTFVYVASGWSLHLDGWGDLWDGFGSGKSHEELRCVLKDSRCGSFGVMGLILAIGLRSSLLSGIHVEHWISASILAAGLGRFGICVAAYFGKYPWSAGMAKDAVEGFEMRQLILAFIGVIPLAVLDPLGWFCSLFLFLLSSAFLAQWANKKLGGVNGDVLGATAVAGELLTFLCIL